MPYVIKLSDEDRNIYVKTELEKAKILAMALLSPYGEKMSEIEKTLATEVQAATWRVLYGD